jgi:hypothetical protein
LSFGINFQNPFLAHRQRRNGLAGIIFFLLIASASSLFAATLTGTVTNGTTNKPSAGDEVVLIKLAAGMEEVGHTKTDAEGKFTFTFQDDRTPHLVRAIHQGAAYHKPAPPGTNSLEVQVYDVSKKVEGVKAIADLIYLQASKGDLAVMRLFAVENNSQPPRTQMSDSGFEFYVPEGAEIDDAQAQTAGGQWVNTSPTPQAEKGRYGFPFPLRPGQTQLRVTYHVRYSGKTTVNPRLIYPLQHLVVIMPRSIGFAPNQSGIYQDKQPPDLPEAIAEVATDPRPEENLAFEISGEGMLQDRNQNASSGASGQPAPSANSRPGGGLGTPGEEPDPLDKYRWWILAGFGLVLAGGAVYTTTRSNSPASFNPAPAAAAASGRSGVLLDALKEELFQLEMEHQQGHISDQDYAKAKSALDQTLARAIKRAR